MGDQVKVDRSLFQTGNGKQLLDYFDTCRDPSDIIEQLKKVLAPYKAMYESVSADTTIEVRRDRRKARIKLFDNLLILALKAEAEEMAYWFQNGTATDACESKMLATVKPKTVYAYLLDQIHEDEEIQFKFYRTEEGSDYHAWQDEVPWLVQSIRIYRTYLIIKVQNAFREGYVKKQEDRAKLLLDAQNALREGDVTKQEDRAKLLLDAQNALREGDVTKQEDRAKLLLDTQIVFQSSLDELHEESRSFDSGRNWRNLARLYWLLGLVRNSPIDKETPSKFKNEGYLGPVGELLQMMIKADQNLLSEKEVPNQPLLQYCVAKYEKFGRRRFLGRVKLDSLLAWASAANDADFVKIILEHNRDCMLNNPKCGFDWEKDMRDSWVEALWNASYKGHAEIVKLLLGCDFPYHLYYSEYFHVGSTRPPRKPSTELPMDPPMEPPLHVAVLRRHVAVVDAFCTKASKHFSCHEKDSSALTPLEVATKLRDLDPQDAAIKRKIQGILLQRPEVHDDVLQLSQQRSMTVDSANAIMVGAALIASITFAGWLQPPLGYASYYQFVDPDPAAPPDSYASYMAIQGHKTVEVFAIFNSLSFFLAIAAVIAGMETNCFIETTDDTYMTKKIERLQHKLKWTSRTFSASVLCVLVAFASAGIAVMPPIMHYRTSMYVTIAIGGFISALLISRMVWFCLPRPIRKEMESLMNRWFLEKNCKSCIQR